MRVAVAVSCLAVLCFAITGPATAVKPLPPVERPCLAATAPVKYGNLIRPDGATRAAIRLYRAAWARFCRQKSGSLNRLLTLADRVETGVERAIAAAHAARRLTGKNADRAHDDLQKRWPAFVPAFMGSIIEYEFFRPQMRVFHRFIKWGDARDRQFFAAEKQIFGTDFKAAPWIRRTWDYGGCTRFATYDWVGNVRRVDGLRAQLSGWYRRRLGAYHDSLKQTITQWSKAKEICTCGAPGTVVPALTRLQAFLAKRHRYRGYSRPLRTTLRRIRSGETKVLSDKLRQCKYG